MKIGLIDPALYTTMHKSPNIGDLVISRAVHRELRQIFGHAVEIVRIPSHQFPSLGSLRSIADAQHVFVGGSNLLWYRLLRPASWKIGPLGLARYRNLILFGVGWGAYNIKPNLYGRWVSNFILSHDGLHSVRDGFTRNIVDKDFGMANVTNTACPTMWCLTEDRLAAIHTSKGEECIFSLTDYDKDPQRDGQLIHDLIDNYGDRLLFWPQGDGDLEYCRSLGYTGRVIERSLDALLKLLTSGVEFDYVGTRLHAGVLCLEHRVRSLVISIDNRAREIAADTGLPTVDRSDRETMRRWMAGGSEIRIRLPLAEIERWKQQFKRNERTAENRFLEARQA